MSVAPERRFGVRGLIAIVQTYWLVVGIPDSDGVRDCSVYIWNRCCWLFHILSMCARYPSIGCKCFDLIRSPFFLWEVVFEIGSNHESCVGISCGDFERDNKCMLVLS